MRRKTKQRPSGGIEEDPCAIGQALAVFDGRWKGAIIWWLGQGPKRFSELRRLIPGVSPRALTMQLRSLERDGMISRRHYMEIPPRVEYARTPLCESLVPVLESIGSWWKRQERSVSRARLAFDSAREDAAGRKRR